MYREARQGFGLEVEQPLDQLLPASEFLPAPDMDLLCVDLPENWTLQEVKLLVSLHGRSPPMIYEMMAKHHLPKKSGSVILKMGNLV